MILGSFWPNKLVIWLMDVICGYVSWIGRVSVCVCAECRLVTLIVDTYSGRKSSKNLEFVQVRKCRKWYKLRENFIERTERELKDVFWKCVSIESDNTTYSSRTLFFYLCKFGRQCLGRVFLDRVDGHCHFVRSIVDKIVGVSAFFFSGILGI